MFEALRKGVMERVKNVLLVIAIIVIAILVIFRDKPEDIEYVSCLNCGQEFAFQAEQVNGEERTYTEYCLCDECGYCRAYCVVGDGIVKSEDIYEQLKKMFSEQKAEEIAEIILEKEISQDEFTDMMYDIWK